MVEGPEFVEFHPEQDAALDAVDVSAEEAEAVHDADRVVSEEKDDLLLEIGVQTRQQVISEHAADTGTDPYTGVEKEI